MKDLWLSIKLIISAICGIVIGTLLLPTCPPCDCPVHDVTMIGGNMLIDLKDLKKVIEEIDNPHSTKETAILTVGMAIAERLEKIVEILDKPLNVYTKEG